MKVKCLTIILMCCLFFPIYGQRKGSIVNIDGSISVAMVNGYFDYCHHRQLNDNWCWAACVQMVLDYLGVEVTQSKIVNRVYGDTYDLTANRSDIVNAIDRWYVNGSLIRAKYETRKNAKTLIDNLVSHSPIIIGLDERYSPVGHAYVLTHIFFKRDSMGNMTPVRVVVVDPAQNGDMETSLDWSVFYQKINTIITITIS